MLKMIPGLRQTHNSLMLDNFGMFDVHNKLNPRARSPVLCCSLLHTLPGDKSWLWKSGPWNHRVTSSQVGETSLTSILMRYPFWITDQPYWRLVHSTLSLVVLPNYPSPTVVVQCQLLLAAIPSISMVIARSLPMLKSTTESCPIIANTPAS